MKKLRNGFINNLRYFCLIVVIALGLMSIVGTGTGVGENEPEGACVYGPPGSKACVHGTYRDECQNDFNGVWYEGKTCDQINY